MYEIIDRACHKYMTKRGFFAFFDLAFKLSVSQKAYRARKRSM
jgi:hypothetical protein